MWSTHPPFWYWFFRQWLYQGGSPEVVSGGVAIAIRAVVSANACPKSCITHLAYSPEIASAMLQRQQASAIVAARKKIVEGAVGMVELALDALATKDVVHLDDERKAAMVSNLLVVLCSESQATPVVNAGSP